MKDPGKSPAFLEAAVVLRYTTRRGTLRRMTRFDVIVIGLGGMGSAALWQLAQRGLRVLGIESFAVGHDRGSSHGGTRIIRKAYFEHPDYVPILHRAYAGWAELEEQTAENLFERTGLLLLGPPNGAIIAGVRRAADAHRLDIAEVSPGERSRRFPGFAVGDGIGALFEADAGFLYVERCVTACVAAAQALGARIVTGERVGSWSADGRVATVETDRTRYEAGALVICGGAWSAALLRDLGLSLEIRRKVVLWFSPRHELFSMRRGCPVFGIETAHGFFYGFPDVDGSGVKVGDHTGGETVADADALDRRLLPSDTPRIRGFIEQFLPGVDSTVLRHSVCMYTMTPDEHFIIDRHPHHANVAFAAGFSGHGFKFAPVVGSVLADLVTQGDTAAPIGFLRIRPWPNRPPLEQAAGGTNQT